MHGRRGGDEHKQMQFGSEFHGFRSLIGDRKNLVTRPHSPMGANDNIGAISAKADFANGTLTDWHSAS